MSGAHAACGDGSDGGVEANEEGPDEDLENGDEKPKAMKAAKARKKPKAMKAAKQLDWYICDMRGCKEIMVEYNVPNMKGIKVWKLD